MISIKISKNVLIVPEIDINSKPDRFAVIWFVSSFIVLYFFSYIFLTQEIISIANLTYSFNISSMSFFAWLIGKEYHSEDTFTGLLAQILSTIILLFVDPNVNFNIVTVLFAFILIRIVTKGDSRINGRVDLTSAFFIVLTTLYLTITTNSWIYPFFLSAALFGGNQMNKANDKNWWLSITPLLFSMFWIYWQGTTRYVIYIQPFLMYLLGFLMIFALIGGIWGKDLLSDRERIGRIVMIFFSLSVLFFGFKDALPTLIPMLMVSVMYLPVRYFNA